MTAPVSTPRTGMAASIRCVTRSRMRLFGVSMLIVSVLATALPISQVPAQAATVPTVAATITVGSMPWGVAFHPNGNTAYVGDSGSHTLSVIDVADRTATTVSGGLLNGSAPAGVVVTPDGSRALFTAYASHGIVALDTNDLSVIEQKFNMSLNTLCSGPLPIGINPNGLTAYVGCWSGQLYAIDTTTLQATEIPTGWDGTDDGQIDDVAYISAIDAVAFVKNRTHFDPRGTFRLTSSQDFVTLPGWSIGFAVDATGTFAYVGDLTGTISVFDLTEFPSPAEYSINVGGELAGITLSPDGQTLFVADRTSNTVKLVDVTSRTVVGSVAVGAHPLRMALSPNGLTGLVANNGANTVTVVSFPESCLTGHGTAASPFLVATADDLAKVGRGNGGCTLSAHYRQTADITMPAVDAPAVHNFTPIALGADFTGVYDGMGYTIDGLAINDTQNARTSMFGQLGPGATVRDMVIANPVVAGAGLVGLIAGSTADGVTVTGITVTDAVVSGNASEVGGIVGAALGTSAFTNINFHGAVTNAAQGGAPRVPARYTGGLMGSTGIGTQVLNVSFSGSVSSTDSTVGGIVGDAFGSIFGQLTVGPAAIAGDETVAGVVGYAHSSTFQGMNVTASVISVNTIAPFSGSFAGGVVGYANTSTFANATVDVSVVGASRHVGGFVGYANTSVIQAANVSGSVSGGTDFVGGITGYTNTSELSDIAFDGAVDAAGDFAGGITGYLLGGSSVTRAVSTGAVVGTDFTGGIAGYAGSDITAVASHMAVLGRGNMTGGVAGYLASNGALTGSYSTGPVTGIGDEVGGLVGASEGAIQRSYSRSSVLGTNFVGGLVGIQVGLGSIVQSYATGAVTGNNAGGLVGFIDGLAPVGSFWDTDTSGFATSAGGTGKTTNEMTRAATYLTVAAPELPAAWTLTNGWQVAQDPSDWGICATVNDGYPFFLREYDTNPCPVVPGTIDVPVRALSCDWGGMLSGTDVVCTLTGGLFGQNVSWSASYNPTFASGTATLGAGGSGSFTFTLPHDAAGFDVMLVVDGWGTFGSGQMVLLADDTDGDVSVDSADQVSDAAPVPTGVPAGVGGPLPNWPLGLVAAFLFAVIGWRPKRLAPA